MKFFQIFAVPKKSLKKTGRTYELFLTDEILDQNFQNNTDLKNFPPDYYKWISGGGTICVNSRYLFIVKRSQLGGTNVNKFSLFTGRADGPEEALRPSLLKRELLEELIVGQGDQNFCFIADSERQDEKLIKAIVKGDFQIVEKELSPLDLPCYELQIHRNGKSYKSHNTIHVGANNEVNVLFTYSLELENMDDVWASDGEYHIEEENKMVFHHRDIYLLDLKTMEARCCSRTGPKKPQYLKSKGI